MKRFIRPVAAAMMICILSVAVPVYSEPEEMPDGVLFDSEYYADKYQDVVDVYQTRDTETLYMHYRTYGRYEGRFPTEAREIAASEGKVSGNAASANKIVKKAVVSDNDIREYYSKSVFIGDSVMTGYKMYVNYYDRNEIIEGENPTIGILMCKQSDEALVELTLPRDSNIYAKEYFYLFSY